MVDEVKQHLEELQQLFRKYKMRKVWLFGSATDEQCFGPKSDIDLLYEPDKSDMSIREFLDYPLYLAQDLEKIFDRKVDLIRKLPFKNPYFKAEIDDTKLLIFDHAQRSKKISV